MTDVALTVRGTRAGEEGAMSDVTGTVSEPKPVDGSGDWVCTVSCPTVFPDEIIKGANAAQALHLSRLFLLDALETNGVRMETPDSGMH